MAATDRRRAAAEAGHAGDEPAARRFLADPDATVRATALGALARMNRLGVADVEAALADPAAAVRRRACEAASRQPVDLVPLLQDGDALVVEAAAWSLGEREAAREKAAEAVVAALTATAGHHHEPLCREAAVAALGAIGDQRGLPAILRALDDKPAVRRRAVIALAPFDGDDVDAALRQCLDDRDWQVRQAAEDLLSGLAP
jgi:HEAT repeat protein